MSDAAEAAADAPAAGGGKSLVKLLIPVVAGLAAGAGGTLGYFAVTAKAPPGAEAAASADAGGAHPAGEVQSAESAADAVAQPPDPHAPEAAAPDAHAQDPHAPGAPAEAEAETAAHAEAGAAPGTGASSRPTNAAQLVGSRGSYGETPAAAGHGPSWKLEPIVTNLASEGAPLLLKLRLELGFDSESARQQAIGRESSVRDALLTLVSSRRVADLTSVEGKVLLKEDIRLRLNHLLDGAHVNNVLVTEFVIQ